MYVGVPYDPARPDDPHRFAPEIRALKGKHGTYAIFSGQQCLYVGVSSRARLAGTLTRHFQTWSPRADGTSPGHTFDRFTVLLQIETFDDPADALQAEQVWIHTYQPLLNRQAVIPAFEPTQDEIDESEPGDMDANSLEELLSFDV